MKIVTAMSGGVDSSLAAALLKEAGHEVTGVMLRLFDERAYGVEAPSKTCCSIKDIEDARNAALKLSIPFHVFNYSGRFAEQVIRRFGEGYAAGRTPNPCLDCNRYIKFEALLEQAVAMGFDGIATGHYARVEWDKKTGRWLLKKAADPKKDQSYVLYTLTQDQLSKLHLPLGGMTKGDTRQMAAARGLLNAQKPDSQDICFVPDGDYAAFLERECGITHPAGNFVDLSGKLLGTHRGLVHYTVGQRRGLGISAAQPLFVIELRPETNEVVVGTQEELYTKRFFVNDLNWISIAGLTTPLRATARTRYHMPEAEVTLYPKEDGVLVEYEQPRRAPAPGQAAVFYDGDAVIGGGTIIKSRL